jgi:hypothetical protein
MVEIKHNSPGNGGGPGTDDQTAAEVPVDTSLFDNNLSSLDADVQTALETIDEFNFADGDKLDDALWNGFVDRTESEILFDDSTYTFSIDPVTTTIEFEFYCEGILYTSSGDSVALPGTPTSGLYVIYYDGGTLTSSSVNPSDADLSVIIRTKCIVSVIYWNNTEGEAVYVGEERHGMIMSSHTHNYLHFYVGLAYIFGLGLSGFSISNGNDDEDAQFGVDAGACADEDIYLPISAVAKTTGMPEYYMLGADAEWTRNVNPGYSIDTYDGTTSTFPYWNEWNGSSWEITEMASGKYVLRHIFATTEKDTPMISIVGQATYNNKPDAYEGAQTEMLELALTDLPLPELKAIGSVLFEVDFPNDVRCRVVVNSENEKYVDWRNSIIDRTSSSPADHNLLSGLQGGSAAEYYHLTSAQHTDLTDGTGTTLHTHAHANMTGQTTDDHHAQVHTIVSHDTTAEGSELTTLTDGSNADALHVHAYGTGDVVGPGSSVDNRIALFDGVTGKLIKSGTSFETGGSLTVVNGNINMSATYTVDGVDISEHAIDVNAHHSQTHTLASHTQGSNKIFMTNGSTFTEIALGASGTYLKSQGVGMDLTWDTPAGGGGEANTASNVGAGAGVWKQKTGVDLEFRSLIDAGSSHLTITQSTDTITFSITAGAIDFTELADDAVTNGKLANMAPDRIKGRITASTGNPEDLTAAQVRTIINVEDGANDGAPKDAPFLCVGTGDPDLTNERYLVLGAGLDYTDESADSYYAIHVQDYTVITSSSGTTTPNASGGAKFELEVDEDTEITIPTNHSLYYKDGQTVEFRITQDGTGGWDVTFNSTYFRTGEIPSVVVAQGAGDITYVLCKYFYHAVSPEIR